MTPGFRETPRGCGAERLLEHSVLLLEVLGLAGHPLVESEREHCDDYLTGVQAGTEVFPSSGQLDTSSYYCTIQ